MKLNKSVVFFDTQFQKQTRAQDFALNPFETLALDYIKGTVLDLGCGLGNLSLEAGARGHQVVAVDASPTAVARINADRLQILYLQIPGVIPDIVRNTRRGICMRSVLACFQRR